jgi:chromate transport protein ChrA
MALVTVQLGKDALRSPAPLALAAAAAFLLLRLRVNPAWLVAGGGAAGWALYLMR